jgi:GNAT superfamily N-acetyltransferase
MQLPSAHGSAWPELLRRADDGRLVAYEVAWMNESHLDQLHALHTLVVSKVAHPHMFRADTRSFMSQHIDARGRTVGILCEGELVAYAAVSFPDDDPDNLGRDLPLPESELRRVADYDGSAVHPAFRGNGLQRLLSGIRNEYALAHDRYHILGTVSPLNPVSLHNFLELGFEVRGLKAKYEGALRYIIHRDLRVAVTAPAHGQGDVEVPMQDIAWQEALLTAGYRGLAVQFDRPEPCLRFGSPASRQAAFAA